MGTAGGGITREPVPVLGVFSIIAEQLVDAPDALVHRRDITDVINVDVDPLLRPVSPLYQQPPAITGEHGDSADRLENRESDAVRQRRRQGTRDHAVRVVGGRVDHLPRLRDRPASAIGGR